jgi:hypothetical protein
MAWADVGARGLVTTIHCAALCRNEGNVDLARYSGEGWWNLLAQNDSLRATSFLLRSCLEKSRPSLLIVRWQPGLLPIARAFAEAHLRRGDDRARLSYI